MSQYTWKHLDVCHKSLSLCVVAFSTYIDNKVLKYKHGYMHGSFAKCMLCCAMWPYLGTSADSKAVLWIGVGRRTEMKMDTIMDYTC